MQLVVKIPKAYYELVLERCKDPVLLNAFKNGTPLPKGHGRIKDIDKIEWYGCTTEFDCPYKDRECKDCNRAECSKTQVDDIPTIIAADKEMDNECND